MEHLCDKCTRECKEPGPVIKCTKHAPTITEEPVKAAPKKESKNAGDR